MGILMKSYLEVYDEFSVLRSASDSLSVYMSAGMTFISKIEF